MEKESIISKQDIIDVIGEALKKQVSDKLHGYNSPLDPIVKQVIDEQQENLKSLIREALSDISKNEDFKKAIKEEFMHKVAKSMVAKLEGTVEKAVDVIRQDQTLRARMVIAIEEIIKA